MKKWTQAWLDYTPRKIGEEVRFLNQVAVDGFDIKNAVIHNALAELQNGVKGMAGITMDISAVKSVESGIEITRDIKVAVRPVFEAIQNRHQINADCHMLCLRKDTAFGKREEF